MGNSLLIIVAAAVLGGGVLIYQAQQTSLEGQAHVADHQEQYLAREAATSAFNIGASDVRAAFGHRAPRLDVASATTAHGAYDLLVTEQPDATVDVTATGRYADAAYRVDGEFIQRFPLTSPLVLDVADEVSVYAAFDGTAFEVRGEDSRPASTTGGLLVRGLGLPQHAILARTDAARASVLGALGEAQRGRVSGRRGSADVVRDPVSNLLDTIYEEAAARVVTTFPDGQVNLPPGLAGTPTQPTIIAVEGDLTAGGDVAGHGVLIVRGDLELRDDFRWEGLIFLTADGSVTVTHGDRARVYGALVARNTVPSAPTGISSGVIVEQGVDRGCNAATTAQFVEGGTSVNVTSTKDLSNVVLDFGDGVHERFEGLHAPTGTFTGTGANAGRWIYGVWVKSGCATSGDGPGYGLYHTNPDEAPPPAPPTNFTLNVAGEAGLYYSEEALGRLGRVLPGVHPTVSLFAQRTSDPTLPLETRASLGL